MVPHLLAVFQTVLQVMQTLLVKATSPWFLDNISLDELGWFRGQHPTREVGEQQGSLWALFKRLKGSYIHKTEKRYTTGTAKATKRQ